MRAQNSTSTANRTTPHQGARRRTLQKADLQQQEAPDDERRDTESHANDIRRSDPTDNEADRTKVHDNETDEDSHGRRGSGAHAA